jgi:hypothetical protein
LKNDTSNGCSLWDVCGGKQRRITPFSRGRSITSRLLVCVEWPSNMSSTGDSFVDFEKSINLLSHFRNKSEFIQPLSRWMA